MNLKAKNKIIFIILISVFLIIGFTAHFALAQDIGMGHAGNFGLQEASVTDPRVFIANIVRFALTFLGIIAVVIIMYGGFVWMTSNGNPDRVTKAKKILISAVIGLIIILSAFAIVTFIVNTTGNILSGTCDVGDTQDCGCNDTGTQTCLAGNVWGTCSPDCDYSGGEKCCSFGCGNNCSIPPEFHINSQNPDDGAINVIRNAKIRFTFNRGIDDSVNVVNNSRFIVSNNSSGLDISGTRVVHGKQIIFTPDGSCGTNPCGATNCFDAGTSVHVEALGGGGGILSFGDLRLACPGSGLDCAINFTIGDLIDCDDPEVNLDTSQICAITNNELNAHATDANELSEMEFFVNGSSVLASNNPITSIGSASFNTSPGNSVNYDASSFPINTNINIRVTATDTDSHVGSDSANFSVRPAHCCNGVLDLIDKEEGIDCGGDCVSCDLNSPVIDWISPQGGFCRDSSDEATNEACFKNSDCASLPGGPGTCDLETANGMPGNLITIGGRFFEEYGVNSQVNFYNGSSWVPASLASTTNSNCQNNWQQNQIIVVMPSLGSATSSIISITASSSLMDTTINNHGPIIKFIVNDIVRPGLCNLDPDHGRLNDLINYEGVNMNGAFAFFGDIRNSVQAIGNAFTNDTSNGARVSNLRDGRTSAFIRTGLSSSNYLNFYKDSEEKVSDFYINSFNPEEGAPGQYVTIYGGGFGDTQGGSQVYFGDEVSGTLANDPFPEVCRTSVWSDNQIIVKVPGVPSDGDYIITIELGSGEIASTSELTPSHFNVDSSLELLPSLCNISPTMGPNLSEISLWGEYFGAPASDNVRFHLNHDQPDNSRLVDGDAEKIETIIHEDAVSGPVQVLRGAEISNSMNLEVGLCTEASDPDAACGTQICCPEGTSEAGRCMADTDACYQEINSSVYEWDFSTASSSYAGIGEPCSDPEQAVCSENYPECDPDDGTSCTPNTFPNPCTCQLPGDDSCQGVAQSTGRCDPIACPNSPGECSHNPGGATTTTGVFCSNDNCNSRFDDCDTCTYDNNQNKCIDSSQGECSLATSTVFQDVLGRAVIANCKNYESAGRWHIKTPLSCPSDDWNMLYGGECVNTVLSCDSCNDGFVCLNDGTGNGECGIDVDICPVNSSCISGECDLIDDASCDCCCDINENSTTEIGNPSCCYPLVCGDDCGSGTGSDGEDYGLCMNCTIISEEDLDGNGFFDDVDINASDDACNCQGSTGKFCDTGAAEGRGVCRDCAQLPSIDDCSDHSGFCCVDAMKNETCRGGYGTLSGASNDEGYGPMTTDNGDPSLAYCSYYECAPEPDYSCNQDHEVIASSSGKVFRDTDACEAECASNQPSALGAECASSTDENSCYADICPSFSCLYDANPSPPPSAIVPGNDSNAPESCGICCCDPHASTDQCSAIGLGLSCIADQEPCSSADRGLCCGCSDDANCGNPASVGCGDDTCCRARPQASGEYPQDGSEDVCRNTEISLDFNQRMNINSFSGNVILVGDYGNEACPEGTQYLALEKQPKNFFARIFYGFLDFMKKIFSDFYPTRLVKAYTQPNHLYVHNYCALQGSVSGENDSNFGYLKFAPSRLLDPDRLYYVIVRGDKNLDGENGILNIYGVGMNGSGGPSWSLDDYEDYNTFNGIYYKNAYIWSFQTLGEQAPNGGVCEIASVDVIPKSYLFTTFVKDNRENDSDPSDSTYNNYPDNDKEFRTQARASDGQIIQAISGYDWDWNWSIENPFVIATSSDPGYSDTENKQLIRAKEGQVDSRTYLRATASSTEIGSYLPFKVAGRSDVYVFICKDPWPPIGLDADGNDFWEPWLDDDSNCTAGSGDCHNANYEFYYCRDAEKVGTVDDLPAILSNSTVVRGENLKCDGDIGDCSTSNKGDDCGPSGCILNGTCQGTCQSYIFKEAYYFREEKPTTNTELFVSNEGSGGTASSSWSNVSSLDPNLEGYKLYWGETSGEYMDYAEIDISGGSDHKDVSCSLSSGKIRCSVENLENKVYYFNLTLFYSTGAEGDYQGEKSVEISDSEASGVPDAGDFSLIPLDGEIMASWGEVSGADSYDLAYGVDSGTYGVIYNVSNGTDLTIPYESGAPLINGQEYYVAVRSVDESGNHSAWVEKSAIPKVASCGDDVCDAGECASGCSNDCNTSSDPTYCCGREGCNPLIGETYLSCHQDCEEATGPSGLPSGPSSDPSGSSGSGSTDPSSGIPDSSVLLDPSGP